MCFLLTCECSVDLFYISCFISVSSYKGGLKSTFVDKLKKSLFKY